MRRRDRRSARLVPAALLAVLAGCGGGGGRDAPPDAGTVLFDGPPAALLPHETGRVATFRVTATRDRATSESGFTATVTANASDGSFVTRYVSATGEVAESTSRDDGSAIRVERFVADPGGEDEEVAVLDPPTVVVATPVIAGDAIETGFARSLELEIRVGDEVVRRSVLFAGSARRVPRARTSVSVPAGTFADAILYAVDARGMATLAVPGASVPLTVEVSGEEVFAPGVGGVQETLDVTIRAGDGTTAVRFVTERTSPP